MGEKDNLEKDQFEKDKGGKDALWEYWAHHRRKWYFVYFYLGVGVNFLLYFTKPYGFDPSGSIMWGSFFGLAVPMATMALGVWIHKKMIGL